MLSILGKIFARTEIVYIISLRLRQYKIHSECLEPVERKPAWKREKIQARTITFDMCGSLNYILLNVGCKDNCKISTLLDLAWVWVCRLLMEIDFSANILFTAQNMEVFRIWSHLMKKSIMENFTFLKCC